VANPGLTTSPDTVNEKMSESTVGIVTVTVDGIRYRGAYKLEEQEFIVTAYGLAGARMDASLLSDGGDRVVLNLAKLMLTDMVNQAGESSADDLTLTMQGATSTICY
jgi:hypothetical protein